MYCQNCGKQVNESLNYCNSCGTQLSKSENISKSVAESLTVSLGYIGGFGLVFFVGLIALMISKNVLPQVVVIISLAYLSTLFGICSMILRQTSNLSAENNANKNREKHESNQTNELEMPKRAFQLDEARQPFVSVTDHTTRTLEEVPVKEK